MVGLDKIVTGDVAAQANFKLVAKDCSNGYSKIITKLSGTTISGKLIENEAQTPVLRVLVWGLSVEIPQTRLSLRQIILTNVEWTTDEKTNGVPLTVALRETTAGAGSIGAFQAKATFNFTYE